MSFFFVDPEIYRRYKDEILKLSNSFQVNIHEHFPADKRQGGLSDREIGEKLGLEEAVVREIRCVAERSYYDLDEWQKAIEFKVKACRAYSKHGLSYLFKYRDEL